MRYLNGYKIFESIENDKLEIRDYLSNLEDIGFYFDFYPDDRFNDFHKIEGYLQVEISKLSTVNEDERVVFKYREIKSEVDRLIKLVSDKYTCKITNVTLSGEEIIGVRIDFFK